MKEYRVYLDTLTLDDFYTIIQNEWENEGNATLYDVQNTEFFYRVFKKILKGCVEVDL